MKSTSILAITIGFFTMLSCSQQIPESEIPSVVLNRIDVEFSNATNVEWEKKGAFYEVEFEVNNVDHEALIEETGTLIKYIKEVSIEELPQMLRNSLTSREEIKKVDDAHLLTIGETSYYQLEFKGPLTGAKKVYSLEGEEMQNINYYD
ncbi:hypothetical protein LZ575_09195 [Antarcticibacterium sp. 1MA-6-2]|uniref:hypothetical protein n=1 Tax=Antarcticibacterium sp. 1MA-6-2 TaxID=2908210 RepID=UPI001F3C4727|nr:hypothetical protein [Antarcticibacterium sp. 1MA-6-2]UJH92623.1 hypothetical protein LZ575_09195 [Antarcticibacterium sp. 1MA-6-2]